MTLHLAEMFSRIGESLHPYEDPTQYKSYPLMPRWRYFSQIRLRELPYKNYKVSPYTIGYVNNTHEHLFDHYITNESLYMGLDQFLIAKKEGEEDKEIYYWRKHYELEIWMYQLYLNKEIYSQISRTEFNNTEVPLDKDDISALEFEVLFGDLSSKDNRRFEISEFHEVLTDNQTYDLEAIRAARYFLNEGWQVYYIGDW